MKSLLECYTEKTDVPINGAYVIQHIAGGSGGQAVFDFPHMLTDRNVYLSLASMATREWLSQTPGEKYISFRDARHNSGSLTVTVFYEDSDDSN